MTVQFKPMTSVYYMRNDKYFNNLIWSQSIFKKNNVASTILINIGQVLIYVSYRYTLEAKCYIRQIHRGPDFIGASLLLI